MIPKLDIKHLAMLRAIAQSGSLTAAANQLGVSQSAMSHRLREAERRLGLPLLERQPGKATLTAEGKRLKTLADQFVEELALLEVELEETHGTGRHRVRIAQATYSRYHWLPNFTDYLAKYEPRLEIDLAGDAGSQPFEALRRGRADVVTVYGRPASMPNYRWRRLGKDPLVAVMAPNHPLAEQDWVNLEDLANERYFTYPLSREPGFDWETILGAEVVPHRIITRMATPEAVIDLVRAGYGIAIFSQWAIEPEVADSTVVTRPLGAEGFMLDWWVVTRESDSDRSAPARLAKVMSRWNREDEEHGLATLGFDGDFDGED